MKKIFKRMLLVLLIILIGIQFIRPARNISNDVATKDISTLYTVPKDVQYILQVSCYDCHSNNTVYPWYANVQPVAWWLNKHIVQGKKELNFSEFAGYSLRRQYHKLEEISGQVKDNEMPLNSYTWIHKNAILTDPQKETLYNWVDAVRDSMKAHYPMDSLIRKKQ